MFSVSSKTLALSTRIKLVSLISENIIHTPVSLQNINISQRNFTSVSQTFNLRRKILGKMMQSASIESTTTENSSDNIENPTREFSTSTNSASDKSKSPLEGNIGSVSVPQNDSVNMPKETFKIDNSWLEDARSEFLESPKNIMALNIATQQSVLDSTIRRSGLETTSHVFNHKVKEVGPVTNQRSTGRCWMFATLNAIRIPFAEAKDLPDFEFSQSYLFYWDKIERCNYFLNNIVEVSKRQPREEVDGRLMSFVLTSPVNDGGQWDMVKGLIRKYGVMPKKCFPETYSCEASREMNRILTAKLREFALKLRKMVDTEASDQELENEIKEQMKVVYRIVGICLGIPPSEFTWEYYDKNKKAVTLGPISPRDFYNQEVKPLFDIEEMVCLVHDPRPEHPHNKLYTVDCMGNMVGGCRTLYNNQTIETLMEVTKKSIVAGQPVWFGCDVSKHSVSKKGILDLDIHDFKLFFDTDLHVDLNKADRLAYGESQMNHAMLLTGVHLDKSNEPIRWRVENSWGDQRNEKGFITMTNEWFKEYVFEVVVHKSHVDPEVLEVFKTKYEDVIILPAWDPMGTLA